MNPISTIESKLLSNEEINDGTRLACQIRCKDRLYVNIQEENKIRKRRIQIDGIERTLSFNPTLKKIHSIIPKPDLNDIRSDVKRTLDFIEKEYALSFIYVARYAGGVVCQQEDLGFRFW